MPTLQSIFIPADSVPSKVSALGAGMASSTVTFSKYAIIAVTASDDIHIVFGNAANMPTAAATGWLISAGSVAEFELGSQWDSVQFYNPNTGTVDIYILRLSRA
jgi:hypothetical protein